MIRLLLRFPWLTGFFALFTLTYGAQLWRKYFPSEGSLDDFAFWLVFISYPGLGVLAYVLCRRNFLASERKKKGC